jgi:hypothetical protein
MNTQITKGELVKNSTQLHREKEETLTLLEKQYIEVKNLYEKLQDVKIEYKEYEDMYDYFQKGGNGEPNLHDELNHNFSKMKECQEWIKEYELLLNEETMEMIEIYKQLIKE